MNNVYGFSVGNITVGPLSDSDEGATVAGGYPYVSAAALAALNAVTPPGLRRFTREDWYGFAGAERFENGTLPLISDSLTAGDWFAVVGGGAGGAVYLEIYDDAPDAYQLQLPSYEAFTAVWGLIYAAATAGTLNAAALAALGLKRP